MWCTSWIHRIQVLNTVQDFNGNSRSFCERDVSVSSTTVEMLEERVDGEIFISYPTFSMWSKAAFSSEVNRGLPRLKMNRKP